MELYKKILELYKTNSSFAIATVTRTTGSVPGKPGFKAIVEENGAIHGTIGGGAIEARAVKDAVKAIVADGNAQKDYILSDKPTPEEEEQHEVVPMMCSGTMTIFYEVHKTQPSVYIFGAGHVGKVLLQILQPLNWHTVLIDNREEFKEENSKLPADEFHLMEYTEFAESFSPRPGSYAVVLTQGHAFDYDVAEAVYRRKLPLSYVGVIASRAKAQGLREMLAGNLPEQDFATLHSPIGLPIGGDTAAEIAVSITAEMQAVRYGKEKIGSH